MALDNFKILQFYGDLKCKKKGKNQKNQKNLKFFYSTHRLKQGTTSLLNMFKPASYSTLLVLSHRFSLTQYLESDSLVIRKKARKIWQSEELDSLHLRYNV